MKGLVYVIAFIIGSALGPVALAPVSFVAAGSQDQAFVQSADSPGTSYQPVGDTSDGSDSPTVPVSGPDGDTPLARETVDAKVAIDAPTRGRVGELIRFDLTRSEADSIKWLLLPDSVDFEVYQEGRRAVFSARAPGSYMFIIAVAKAGTVDVVTHTVKIEGPPPKPESTSLTEWVPYWLYPMQLDPKLALKLAVSFEEVSDRITALSTPKGIIEATAEANRAALGDELDTWKPLLKKIQASLANMARAGVLTTPEQHKETWLQIAKGLRKYAS